MKKLQELLNMEIESEDKDGNKIMVPSEFILKVQSKESNKLHAIVHSLTHSSDTVDIYMNGEDSEEFWLIERGVGERINYWTGDPDNYYWSDFIFKAALFRSYDAAMYAFTGHGAHPSAGNAVQHKFCFKIN